MILGQPARVRLLRYLPAPARRAIGFLAPLLNAVVTLRVFQVAISGAPDLRFSQEEDPDSARIAFA